MVDVKSISQTYQQCSDGIVREANALKSVVAFERLGLQLRDVVLRQVQLHQDLEIAKSVLVDEPEKRSQVVVTSRTVEALQEQDSGFSVDIRDL